VDVVVAHAIDRLSRDPEHMGYFLYECDRAGVEVEFVTEKLDDSLEGQLIRFVRGVAAKIEHSKIRERSMRGRGARVQAGKPLPGCKAPYGYRWADEEKTRLEEDPETAPTVRRIFDALAAGRTLRNVAGDLTNEGIPTAKGRPCWESSTISQLVRNPIYVGEAVALLYAGKKAKQTGRGDRITLGDGRPLALAGAAPALIDATTFQAVQERLTANKAQASRNNRAPEATLLRGGYVRCGLCGRAMAVHRQGRKVKYICTRSRNVGERCRFHSISAPLLDGIVWERVTAVLTDPAIIREKLTEMEAADTIERDIIAVEKTLAGIGRKQQNVGRAIAALDDADAAAPLVVELKALAKQQKEAEARRETLLEQQARRALARRHLTDLQAWCAAVAARLENAGYAIKREALEYLGVTVTVLPTDHPGRRYVIEASLPIPDGEHLTTPLIVGGTSGSSCVSSVYGRAADPSASWVRGFLMSVKHSTARV
jgi:site-specific DNA recombinase